MADESISIEIVDNVAPSIVNKFYAIAASARAADAAIKSLQAAMKLLDNVSSVTKLQTELAKLNSQVLKNTVSQNNAAKSDVAASLAKQRLATETQRTQAALVQVETALNRAVAAEAKASQNSILLANAQTRASIETERLAQATLKTETALNRAVLAETNAALANEKLALEVQKTQSAMAQVEITLNRAVVAENAAATSAAKLSTAEQVLAASTAKVATAENQTATAAQRLATEQQRTAVQTSQAAAAASRAESAALRLAQAQEKAENSTKRAASSMQGFLTTVLALLGTGFGVFMILQMSDAYTTLQNKLQNVSTSQAQVNELTNRLFSLANDTRQSVEATATAFTRFDRSLKSLGKSQEDTFRLTETVNKALVVSGATASESASALLQLSQAFNSGKLQGDEFKALAENMPIVLDAVAKALNVPINKVKEMGTAGKITSKVLFDAFKLIESQIDETFAKTVPTLSQSMTVLKNSATQFFGELNKSTGVTAALSLGIIELSNNLDILAFALTLTGTALLVYFGPALLNVLRTATAAVLEFTVAIASNPIGLLVIGITSAIAAIAFFGDKISVTADGLVSLKDIAQSTLSFIYEGFRAVGEFLVSAWSMTMEFLKIETTGFGDGVLKVLDFILEAAKIAANSFIAPFVAAFDVIKNVANGQAPEIAAAFTNAFSQDFIGSSANGVGNAWAAVMDRARKIALAKIPQAPAKLREAGADISGGDVDEKRATALAKVNAELNNQLSRLFLLKPAREAQAQFDKIEENLIGKKIILTAAESAALKEKIKTIQDATDVQRAYDRIFEDATAPARDYSAALEASNKLLANGAISQAEYGKAILGATESYKKSTEPLFEFNRQLQQQYNLLLLLPKQREVEQQVQQVSNALLQKNIILTEAETQALRDRLTMMQELNIVSQQEDQLLANSVGKREEFITQLKAINLLKSNAASGFNAGDAAEASSNLLKSMGLDTENLQIQADANVNVISNMYAQVDKMLQAQLINERDAAGLRAQIWSKEQTLKFSQAKTFFSSLEGLSKSNNSKVAAIGKAAAISSAIINTYNAATGAYASLASIPYVGPVLGAAAAAAAIATGLANVAAIRSAPTGYMSGGYTGNMPTTEVAGVVHGQEFVMNAAATNRIGVANLQAMQDGSASSLQSTNGSAQASGGGYKTAINVNIVNNASGVQHEVRQIDEHTVEVIAERVVKEKSDAITANNLGDPSSKTSRSLAKNTKTIRNL